MNKRLAVLFSMIILSATLFGEIELGMSYSPGEILKTDESAGMEAALGSEEGTLGDTILGFHVGYSFWWLFYASYDALIVPPWYIYENTGTTAPGYLSFIDVGIRPSIGPVYLLATVGINNLYIHSAYSSEEETDVGVNFRVGLGLKFNALSINLVGTAIFSDFNAMQDLFSRIDEGDPNAEDELLRSLMPSIGFNLHL